MKLSIKMTMTALTFCVLIACKDGKNQSDPKIKIGSGINNKTALTLENNSQKFKDGITETIWQAYLQVRNALIESDAVQVQKGAVKMGEGLNGEHPELQSLAHQMAETDDLEKQRELFSDFTDKAGPMFKDAITAGIIYQQYCPMAFNNKGAFWYSDIAEIRNPYFGDKMLKCGKVTQTIEK